MFRKLWLMSLALALAAAWGCATHPAPAPETAVRLVRVETVRGLPQNSAPNTLSNAASLAVVQAERDRYWMNAKQEVYRSVLELMAQHQTDEARGLRFARLMHGNRARREIALTFDDGPHPAYTPKLLAILKREKVPATFFVVGHLAEEHPDLIRAEIADGNTVGNHTYDHVSLVKIPQQYVATEIKACGEVLEHITGKAPRYFRPPGGEYDPGVAKAARALGYTMVLWTDDPGDYASPGANLIEDRTLAKARNGGILLLHDGIPETIQILPSLIHTLKAEGYHFVTVDEMAREVHGVPGLTPAPGAPGVPGRKVPVEPTT